MLSEIASCSRMRHGGGGAGGVFPSCHVSPPFPSHSCMTGILIPNNALALKPRLALRVQGDLSQGPVNYAVQALLPAVFWIGLVKWKD